MTALDIATENLELAVIHYREEGRIYQAIDRTACADNATKRVARDEKNLHILEQRRQQKQRRLRELLDSSSR